MKLTEKDVIIEQHMNGFYLNFSDKKFNKSKENIIKIRQQILENQRIVHEIEYRNEIVVKARDYHELRDKAEKWDKRDSDRTNLLTESNTKYRQEIKQLKENQEQLLSDKKYTWNEYDNLKQKLEKVKDWAYNTLVDKYVEDAINKIIDEDKPEHIGGVTFLRDSKEKK